MKRCTKCGVTQAYSEFYPDGKKALGLKPSCKTCIRAYRRGRTAAGLTQAFERARYARSAHHRAKVAEQTRKWKSRNPEKVEAENIVAEAIKHGVLTRQPCMVCGGKAHAHHADYAEALEVQWLCPLHHARQHVAEGRLDHLRVVA